jgi:hypothetical protein
MSKRWQSDPILINVKERGSPAEPLGPYVRLQT